MLKVAFAFVLIAFLLSVAACNGSKAVSLLRLTSPATTATTSSNE